MGRGRLLLHIHVIFFFIAPNVSRANFFETLRKSCTGLVWNQSGPVSQSEFDRVDKGAHPFLWLATTLDFQGSYEPVIEGRIPESIRGTLYRNGPGRFHRGDDRLRAILDGDGNVQKFRIADGRVEYSTRFVATTKFEDETAAGRFLHRTWSTNLRGAHRNFGLSLGNQAGVTVVRRGHELFALDEFGRPYRLNPDTLETLNEAIINADRPEEKYQAHTKIDAATGNWLLYSLKFGKDTTIRVTEVTPTGKITVSREIPLPRTVYMHDWAVTQNYFVFILHPVFIPLKELGKALIGRQAVIDSIRWRPEEGNVVLLVPRDSQEKVKMIDAKSRWLWHIVNAFEEKGQLNVDFIGSSKPDFGASRDNSGPLVELMKGKVVYDSPTTESWVRRYAINPRRGTLTEYEMATGGDYELPTVNEMESCLTYRYGYACRSSGGLPNTTSIARIDTHTQTVAAYDFGKNQFVSEPIYIPADDGYLAVEVLDGNTGRTYLAILRAARIEDGPIAKVHLEHHVPLSFHGTWVSE
jgi:all-trans-8'-apo-beta-carotenal 15,15'-oxygenase